MDNKITNNIDATAKAKEVVKSESKIEQSNKASGNENIAIPSFVDSKKVSDQALDNKSKLEPTDSANVDSKNSKTTVAHTNSSSSKTLSLEQENNKNQPKKEIVSQVEPTVANKNTTSAHQNNIKVPTKDVAIPSAPQATKTPKNVANQSATSVVVSSKPTTANVANTASVAKTASTANTASVAKTANTANTASSANTANSVANTNGIPKAANTSPSNGNGCSSKPSPTIATTNKVTSQKSTIGTKNQSEQSKVTTLPNTKPASSSVSSSVNSSTSSTASKKVTSVPAAPKQTQELKVKIVCKPQTSATEASTKVPAQVSASKSENNIEKKDASPKSNNDTTKKDASPATTNAQNSDNGAKNANHKPQITRDDVVLECPPEDIVDRTQIIKNVIIFGVMLLPSIVVFIYTSLFYDPMYISTSTFTIKSSSTEKVLDFSPARMLNGNANKDLYVASAYIKSLDLFLALDKEFNLKKHFSEHDIISSLPVAPTLSEIENYWDDVVEVKLDSESELLSLSVKTYDPKFSKNISDAILLKLDELVNTMNAKAVSDAIKLASYEVEKAKDKVKEIAEEIRVFRNNHTFIDPATEAQNILSIINNLENNVTQAKAELSQKLSYLRPDAIEVVTLKSKIASLEDEIRALRKKIALPDAEQKDQPNRISSSNINTILSESLGEYEKLNIEYQFAQKVLESALSNLEATSQISLSKSKYLVKIDEPKIPDESLWPRPILASIITLILTIFSLGGISLLVSAIREHLGI